MATYKHRELESTVFLGERIDFISANDRIRERVQNLSHEKHVLDKLVAESNPDDVFWDIGACLGIHSFVLAKHLPNGTVISFEPMHTNRAVCVDNKQVNELDNVHISELALSNEDGQNTFQIRESLEAGYGRHSLATSNNEYEYIRELTVPTAKGDDIEYNQPNIVKIDVEGASPLVLEGMEETLSDPACHTVVLETHEPNPVQPSHEDFGYTTGDIINKLEEYGFTVNRMEEEFHLYGTKKDNVDFDLSTSEIDIDLIQGDIAEENTDAIVNSAGTSLRMGTGVAGSLKEKGGHELHMDALENGPVDLGTATVTDAYKLDTNYVIHAASMPHYGDGQSTPESIKQATVNALQKADDLGCENISIPAIGCGLGGVSLSTGVSTIINALLEYDPDSLQNVSLVFYSESEYNTAMNLVHQE